jgi:hypothetical protein
MLMVVFCDAHEKSRLTLKISEFSNNEIKVGIFVPGIVSKNTKSLSPLIKIEGGGKILTYNDMQDFLPALKSLFVAQKGENWLNFEACSVRFNGNIHSIRLYSLNSDDIYINMKKSELENFICKINLAISIASYSSVTLDPIAP